MHVSRLSTVDAFVIRRKNIGEADRMVTLFTRQRGKLRVLARGVRKISSRRGPHIEIFNHVTATVYDKKTLTEASSAENFDAIRKDLRRVNAAYYLCELIDGLLPAEQIHEDVFTLLGDAFGALAQVKKDRIEVLRERFAAALLRTLGFLERGKKPPTGSLDTYVEQLLERRLKTVRLASQLR